MKKTMDVLPGRRKSDPEKFLVIRDPKTLAILPTDKPTTVPCNSYWTRRLLCKDVVEAHAKAPKSKRPKPDKEF